ncbi:MAG: trypsin-like peptidase domain-containing protein [Planctomycetes bacterium]|nr:trypsin-like peptidase domain-containing protein [Planctomycetota bacterium]
MRSVSMLIAISFTAAANAQGDPYAFEEREPRTLLEQVIDSNLASVVKIHGASGLATIDPYASGVVVSEQGHILTLDLVMVQRDKTKVVLADGSVHDAELLPPETNLGVRLLKIDPTGLELPLRPLRPADSIPRNGTFVVSIGNCFRLAEFSEKLSATFGVVTATARTNLRYMLRDVDYDGDLILTDAPNNPGQFGGALVTLDGRWIGLNTRVVESRETNTQISAAIPTRDLRAYLARWIDGEVERPMAETESKPVDHGIELFDAGGRRSPPAYVERVRRGSPAAAIGLKPDDLIVRLDRFAIRSCAEFRDVMAKFVPGQKVEVTFKRGTRVQKATIELGEAESK